MRRVPRPLAVVVALALASAAGQLCLGVVRPALDVVRARDWVAVPLVEGRADVLPFHGVVHADFTYRYRVAGTDHVGHRYAFVHPSAFVDEDTMLGFQDGLGRTAWVSPTDPDASVVVRDVPRRGYRLAGLYVTAVGLVLLGLGWLLSSVRGPVSSTLRVLAAVPIGLLALLLLVDSFDPFAMMDLATDEIHDPGCVLEHALVDVSWALLAIGAVVALLGSAPPLRPISDARPGRGS